MPQICAFRLSGQSVGRFDRQQTEARDLPAILGTAAEEFHASIEREVRSVIETAQTRADEIERQAEFNASRREQLSEHRAQQIVDSVFNRASRVLDSIDLVESALSGMLDALRAELQSLAPHGQSEMLEREAVPQTEAERALAPPVEEPALQAAPPPEPEVPEPEVPQPAAEAPPSEKPAAEAPPPGPPVPETPVEEAPAPETPVALDEHQPVSAEQSAVESFPDQSEPVSEQTEAEWQENEGWPGPIPLKPEAHQQVPEEGGPSEFDRMVRRQLTKMRSSGKSRAEAEQFLERFHFAGDYLGLVDEVYGGNGALDEPRRKGLFSRLRRRDI